MRYADFKKLGMFIGSGAIEGGIKAIILGLVLAAFALIAAFLSDSYTLQLQRNTKGVKAFSAPFMINVGFDVGFVRGPRRWFATGRCS